MYKKMWSEFEVQSLAFGILRKQLYPTYLVRGEYKFEKCRVDIAIFKSYPDKEPELKCVVEVKKTANGVSFAQGERYTDELKVPCVYVRGIEDAYKVMEKVTPYL